MEANSYSYERIEEIAKFLLDKTKHRPKIGIVCGSGLGGLADILQDADSFSYENIPHFPVSTVPGHKGRLVFGLLQGVATIVMQGRFHGYEGYPPWKCAMPIRVMKLVGVKTVILTNAAGGVNDDFQVGDVMIIKDHISIQAFAGNNPLHGPNDDRWGTRFPSMSNIYNTNLRRLAKKQASKLGMDGYIREGVYALYGGPSYETVAELKFMRLIGGDAAGMSTVHEAITARHCGLNVFAFSLITNKCVMGYDTGAETNHEEVLQTGEQRKSVLLKFVSALVVEFVMEPFSPCK